MLKKLLLLVLLCVVSSFSQDITGSGTSIDPYILYDAYDLDTMRTLIDFGTYFELGADIDLSVFPDFAPLPFLITSGQIDFGFDGKGYTISNLTQSQPVTAYSGNYAYYGLFSNITGSTDNNIYIKNFTAYNWSIIDTFTTSNIYIGVIGGAMSKVTISNIYVENCNVEVVANCSESYGGGIIGNPSAQNIISRCKVVDSYFKIWSASQIISGLAVGGIAGGASGTISECYTSGNYFYLSQHPARKTSAGGIAGVLSAPSVVENCYAIDNYYEIPGDGACDNGCWVAGGIVGYTTNEDFNVSYTYASLDTIMGTNNAGSWGGNDNSYDAGGDSVNQLVNYAQNNYDAWGNNRYPPRETPQLSSLDSLKSITYYTSNGWDFTTVWGIDPKIQDGLPYLLEIPAPESDNGRNPRIIIIRNP